MSQLFISSSLYRYAHLDDVLLPDTKVLHLTRNLLT
jgi:hypothetical protein